MKFIDYLTPGFLKVYIKYFRNHVFKKTVRKFGWKLIAAIFIFYLIRDSLLYIIIPYFAAKGIFNF